MRSPLPLVLLATLALASSAAAQSIASGDVAGQVRGPDREGLPDAVVTLRSLDLGITQEAATDMQGDYSLQFLTPGRYELRVEAVGYAPTVYPLVRVEAGTSRTINIDLTPAAPPVTHVDTVTTVGTLLGRWRGSGPVVSSEDLDAQRDLLGGWTSLARFSSLLDPSLGAQGLPGVMTTQVVDGVPFFAARHPYLMGESTGSPAFPAALLSRTSVLANPADIYWLGAPGATLSADTRAGLGQASTGVEGSWSGAPLWSSGTLDVPTKPSLTSYRAALHAGFALVPDTSLMFVAGEALRQQDPMPSRIPVEMAASLDGLDPAVLEALSSPTVETVSRASGLARLDRWGDASRFTLRAAGGHETRRYDGADPGVLAYGMGLPEDATDLSAAMSLISRYDSDVSLELLGGVSLSDRTYGDASGLPAATLVGSGIPVGQAADASAKVSRLDLYLAPALHMPLWTGRAKVGVAVHATNHKVDQTWAGDGDIFFSDATGLLAGNGVYSGGSSAESSFSTTRIGAFAQYAWDAAPGLRIAVGGRVDWEVVPTSGVRLNADWAAASGAPNNEFPSRYTQPGAVISATWDIRGDGRTILFAATSVANGSLDPGLIHEATAQDGDATLKRFVGSGISWPDLSNGPSGAQSLPVLTLLGPDTRPPRTSELGGGIVQDLGSGWVFHASFSARRTDFLPRRRNVNLPIYPLATDANGRDLLGDLHKVGSVVAADVGTNRRFSGFDAVWAIDPDGWSKYKGASIGLEYATDRTDAFVSYTHSQTTDNWVGASKGLPDATLDPHLPGNTGRSWAEGTSDFDIPDRMVAGARVHLDVGQGADLSATYTYQSGRPFTPGYRTGVDANGDGSARNDVAFVPSATELGSLAGSWSCLADQAGGFAVRNSCRGPTSSTLNAGLRVAVLSAGGRPVYLTVEGFNLIEDKSGIVDSALLLVDPNRPIQRSADGSVVTIPTTINPDFGTVVLPRTPGRILRVGLRIGG
jgi:hypothetical protein